MEFYKRFVYTKFVAYFEKGERFIIFSSANVHRRGGILTPVLSSFSMPFFFFFLIKECIMNPSLTRYQMLDIRQYALVMFAFSVFN